MLSQRVKMFHLQSVLLIMSDQMSKYYSNEKIPILLCTALIKVQYSKQKFVKCRCICDCALRVIHLKIMCKKIGAKDGR